MITVVVERVSLKKKKQEPDYLDWASNINR